MALQGRLPLTCADYFGSARYCEHQQRSSEVTRIDNLVEILVHRGRNECAVDVMRGFEGAPWGGVDVHSANDAMKTGPRGPFSFVPTKNLPKACALALLWIYLQCRLFGPGCADNRETRAVFNCVAWGHTGHAEIHAENNILAADTRSGLASASALMSTLFVELRLVDRVAQAVWSQP